MGSLFPHLLELVEDASRDLPGVSPRRMFGCDALFAYGNIYALIWKDGRIGLKLPEPSAFEELMAMPGAVPWTPGRSAMSHWVLVPEDFHDQPERLVPWVRRAHALAAKAPSKMAKAASKAKVASKPKTASKPKAAAKVKPAPKAKAAAKARAGAPRAR